jgi:hypothetical protein
VRQRRLRAAGDALQLLDESLSLTLEAAENVGLEL